MESNTHTQVVSPIHRLSPELLSQIFLYLAWSSPNLPEWQTLDERDWEWFQSHGHAIRHYEYRDCKWFRILHVCQYWRHVGLSCALLWTNINTSDTDFRTFKLKHSLGLPISFGTIHITESTLLDDKEDILSNLNRVQQLVLGFDECEDESVDYVFSQMLSSNNLKSLQLQYFPDIFYSRSEHLELPEVVLSLSSFSLDGLLPGFQPGTFDNMTELCLSHELLFSRLNHPSITVPAGFDYTALERMPNLRRLCLQSAPLHVDSPPPIRPVSLPRLREFCFSGTLQPYLWVSQYLRIPPMAGHHLHFAKNYFIERDQPKLYETLATVLKARVEAAETRAFNYRIHFSLAAKLRDRPIRKVMPEFPDRLSPSIRILVFAVPPFDSTIRLEESIERAIHTPILSINEGLGFLPWEDVGTTYFPAYLSHLAGALPAEAVEEVYLRSNLPLGHDDADKTAAVPTQSGGRSKVASFLACTGVRTLILEGANAVEWVARYLSLRQEHSEEPEGLASGSLSEPGGFVVFPNLENLVLKNVSWTKEVDKKDKDRSIPYDEDYYGCDLKERIPPIVESIAAVLESRAREFGGRHRLKRLEVMGGMPEWWIRKVEVKEWIKAEGGVEWDGLSDADWANNWRDDVNDEGRL